MSHAQKPLVTSSPDYPQQYHYNPTRHHKSKYIFMCHGIKARRIAELLDVRAQTVACALNGGVCSFRMDRRLTELARKIEAGEIN